MEMPVDVKAVLDAALNIDQASNTPISISVYLDETAPADSVAHVRAAFASAAAHARVTIAYLGGPQAVPNPADDIAVIVAGVYEGTGRFAKELREAGVPVMIATTLPCLVEEIARESGYPIPDGDIISPIQVLRETTASKTFERITSSIPFLAGEDTEKQETVDTRSDSEIAASALKAAAQEPYALDKEKAAAFSLHMGEWVIEAGRAKRLAFALALPFVRKPLAVMSVNETSVQNAAIGFVLFIPGADMPVLTLNQCKMVMQIAAAYGEKLDSSRAKELAAVVAGGFGCRAVARSVAGVVPGLGWAVRGAVGFTGTKAMGLAAIEYFEAGGGASGVASVVGSARDAAIKAASAIQAASTESTPESEQPAAPEDWQQKVQQMAETAGVEAKKIFDTAAPVARGAAKVGASALKDSVLKSLSKTR